MMVETYMHHHPDGGVMAFAVVRRDDCELAVTYTAGHDMSRGGSYPLRAIEADFQCKFASTVAIVADDVTNTVTEHWWVKENDDDDG